MTKLDPRTAIHEWHPDVLGAMTPEELAEFIVAHYAIDHDPEWGSGTLSERD